MSRISVMKQAPMRLPLGIAARPPTGPTGPTGPAGRAKGPRTGPAPGVGPAAVLLAEPLSRWSAPAVGAFGPSELDLAARIQRHLLPARTPQLEPFDVAAHCEPCLALGGDFYDFLTGRRERLGLLIGDVSGKGIAASLLMASVLATLRAHSEDLSDLGRVMGLANRDMFRHAPAGSFATAFLGRLDARRGHRLRLRYASAGHEPALLVRGGGVRVLDEGGMPLGVEEDEPYATAVLDLLPGDVLLLYTDGMTEARNVEGKLFGRDTLRAAAAAADARHSAARIRDDLLAHVRWFIGTARPADDTTLVVVRVGESTGDGAPAGE
jgi:sigma-B regulation protein RsbU (phosphoserine phosphatase)